MEDPVQEQEAEASPADEQAKRQFGRGVVRFAGKLMPKFGLFLFIVAIPGLLAAYPAYILSSHLKTYSSALPVKANLAGFEIKTIDSGEKELGLFEPRKHVEVTFSFRTGGGTLYTSVVRKSWPAPGLKRKLSEVYAEGDDVTLYRLADNNVVMEELVAREIILRLTTLMALLFVFSTLAFLMWKRLAAKMTETLSRFPDATFKSIAYGQLITLLLAGLVTGMTFIRPFLVPVSWYLGAYLGLAALLGLSLRLLAFEEPPQPAPETEGDRDSKSLRPA